jgi:plastocyanin
MAIVTVLVIPQVLQATQWHATVGAQSKNMGRQALAFLPNEIWIHEGDSITWKFDVDEVHTLTFLKSGQVRPPFFVGCPGFASGSATFDGSACVSTPALVKGATFTVEFPQTGNFKLVCLFHPNMTGVVHVLELSKALPHNQDFYDDAAEDEARELLSDAELDEEHDHDAEHEHGGNHVTVGIGEVSATPGGSSTLSVMRFIEHTKVIHAGQTVEWGNADPVTPHTITFGTEPANVVPPSANVTTDADGARHATINSTSDTVHSGFIVAAPQDRTGLPQSPLGVTRFRVTFTKAGTYNYICALHDDLGMKGKIIVLP